MTEKIYYRNPAAQEITAAVLGTGTDEKGEYAVLDRTCFYPEGGGQPADTGFIGDIEVTDVQRVDGEIRHYTAQLLENGEYTASIDWERRFDHMQQHTGQHLLSAVFEDVFSLATNSFHLGTERVSIDLDVPSIDPARLKEVERQVNLYIRRQLPVETEWVTQEQAAGLPLRKKPAVEGDIRLVKILDIDLNACGGTHLSNTAELGLLKIIRTEKAKKATRVYFLCGNRAMAHFDLLQSVTDQLTKNLNAPAAELPGAAVALVSDRKEKEKQLKKLNLQILEMEADNLQPVNNLLIKEFRDRPFKDVLQLAQLTLKKNPSLYLLFTVPEESGMRMVTAKGENAAGDMKQIMGKLLVNSDGSAGGKENLAQASVSGNRESEIFADAFREALKEITLIV